MSAVMDMSLDDIIKNNKKSGFGSSRGRIRPFGYGPTHRFPNRAANRAAPYATAKASNVTWQHDLYADQHVAAAGYPAQGGRAASIEIGIKLYISNLDYGVSNDDIKKLLLVAHHMRFSNENKHIISVVTISIQAGKQATVEEGIRSPTMGKLFNTARCIDF
ncbi:THO complex subunit 4A [Glycine max]|nr:THO complex subunit 4A [Glycine max]